MKFQALTLFLLCAICFSSCMTYQYATVESNLAKNDNGEIIQENDSVQIRYKFSGEGCPVLVQIHNKLNTPLYINWERSSIVLDGRALNNKDNTLEFNGEIDGTLETRQDPSITTYSTTSISSSSLSGKVQTPKKIGFIPPNSFVEDVLANSIRKDFFKIHAQNEKAGFDKNAFDDKPVWKTYSKEQSPMKFRSYLTLSTDSEFKTSFVFDDEFWISQISGAMLNKMSSNKYRQDQFYNKSGAGNAGIDPEF
jgi:hypothetical protein